MTRDERKVTVALAAALLRPCLICGRRPDIAGLFIPNDPREWGAPPAKTRMLVYSLCQACFEGTTTEEVDARIDELMGRAA
jgi:hypothetical protein